MGSSSTSTAGPRDGGGEATRFFWPLDSSGQLLAQKPFHAARLGGGMLRGARFRQVHPQVLGRKRDLVTHRPHEELAARVPASPRAEALGALPRCEPAHVGPHTSTARQIAGKERARQPVHQAQHGWTCRRPSARTARGSGREPPTATRRPRGCPMRARQNLGSASQPPLGFVHVAKRSPVEQHGRRPLAFPALAPSRHLPHAQPRAIG